MTDRVRVRVSQLPSDVTKGLRKFLFGYHLPTENRYVINDLDTATKTSRELEFDIAQNRFLTSDERLRIRPGPKHLASLDDNFEVRETFWVKDPDDEMWVHIEVYKVATGTLLATIEQQVYSPTPWVLADLVSDAVKRAELPETYASWSEDDKIRYMASMIHQWRRGAGSSGADEDDALTPELLAKMERIDPNVRSRFSPILDLAARMGQIEPDELKRSFAERLGIVVP